MARRGDPIHSPEPSLHDTVEEKHQRSQRLILSGRGNALLDRQRRQEYAYLLLGHLPRMSAPVEADEAPNPVHVRLARARTEPCLLETSADDLHESQRATRVVRLEMRFRYSWVAHDRTLCPRAASSTIETTRRESLPLSNTKGGARA